MGAIFTIRPLANLWFIPRPVSYMEKQGGVFLTVCFLVVFRSLSAQELPTQEDGFHVFETADGKYTTIAKFVGLVVKGELVPTVDHWHEELQVVLLRKDGRKSKPLPVKILSEKSQKLLESLNEIQRQEKKSDPAQTTVGEPIVNSIGVVLVLIPAGEFQMGSPDSDNASNGHEKPQHLVQITKPFYLSTFEVTQEQYEQVMGNNPSGSIGANKPVENVNWHDAIAFCRKLSDQERVEYRLPTEAEWEYACRGGTTTVYSFGDDASQLGQYAWYDDNSGNITHAIGQKLANPWGLYDMYGNVWEWCQDGPRPYRSETVTVDPIGPSGGRVLRGGAFGLQPWNLRSAYRGLGVPDFRGNNNGFRLARTYELSP